MDAVLRREVHNEETGVEEKWEERAEREAEMVESREERVSSTEES